MIQITINAKKPGNKDKGIPDKAATLLVNYPDFDKDADAAMKEAITAYGAKAILTNALANWRVTLQAAMRTAIEAGETQEAMQARLGSAKMGVATTGAAVDSEAAFRAKFLAASPADRAKMLDSLKALAAQK